MPDDELILEPSNGAKPRKKRKPIAQQAPQDKLQSSSAIVRLEGKFQILFAALWGFPVILSYGKDRALLKKLVDQLGAGDEKTGEEMTGSLMDDFFKAVQPVGKGGDPVVSKCRYSNISDFAYHAPQLLLNRSRGPQLSDRTARNVSEIKKAMGQR